MSKYRASRNYLRERSEDMLAIERKMRKIRDDVCFPFSLRCKAAAIADNALEMAKQFNEMSKERD